MKPTTYTFSAYRPTNHKYICGSWESTDSIHDFFHNLDADSLVSRWANFIVQCREVEESPKIYIVDENSRELVWDSCQAVANNKTDMILGLYNKACNLASETIEAKQEAAIRQKDLERNIKQEEDRKNRHKQYLKLKEEFGSKDS